MHGMNGRVGPNGIEIEVKDSNVPEELLRELNIAATHFEEIYQRYCESLKGMGE